MKKIASLAFVLMLVSVASYSQNYIGMSKDLIIHQLQSSLDFGKIECDKLDDLKIIKYANIDITTRKVIFLDDDGRCSKFIVIHNDYNKLKGVKREMNQNYDRTEKDTWLQRGDIDYMWQLDKKQKFFALVVTVSNNQTLSMNLQ